MKNIPSVTFMYSTTEEYEREVISRGSLSEKSYDSRNKKSTCFYPEKYQHNDNQEIFTLDYFQRRESIMKERGELEMEEESGYVICIHSNQWWLGCVLCILYVTEVFRLYSDIAMCPLDHALNLVPESYSSH